MPGTIFRKKVLKVKKAQGKNISITENLIGYRMSDLNEAREKFDFKNVWTYDGRVLYKDNNDGQKLKSVMNRIYFETLMFIIKWEKVRLYIFCCLNILLFSLRGSENLIFISVKFCAFGKAPLILTIICKILLVLFFIQ